MSCYTQKKHVSPLISQLLSWGTAVGAPVWGQLEETYCAYWVNCWYKTEQAPIPNCDDRVQQSHSQCLYSWKYECARSLWRTYTRWYTKEVHAEAATCMDSMGMHPHDTTYVLLSYSRNWRWATAKLMGSVSDDLWGHTYVDEILYLEHKVCMTDIL